MKTLAVDIGGTKIALGLVFNGKLQKRRQVPTPDAQSAFQYAQFILNECKEWLTQVDNIGVSTTGLVGPEGISSINPDTLSFPVPFPLGNELEKQSNLPVKMLNDAQAAAWYEFLQLDRKCQNMAYVTVSTGVGGGLILNGKLYKGSGHLAGHIGHMVIDSDGPVCGCGQKGCVEAIASGTAIHKRSKEIISPDITNIELFALSENDSKAEAIIQESAKAIATLCCNLKSSLDVDTVVIGGGIGLAPGYLDKIIKDIELRPECFQVSIVPAKGSHDACLLGAAYQFEG
ncbi:N-acetylmannosamine kinase [Vibrio sp. JC009]|uniref:N-acetylmannosamine kinase n=1 Tax=Vibrio sp. JC009 TaxID=2912314 RepID=UPI0023B06542|nr:N-acetylmannosamine kinase [Vibrio sp. JC009]WED24939.1 N-acetylmannosamine kinase [Vibrio sp. JC009]